MTCHLTLSAREYMRAIALSSWAKLPKTLLWLALLACFFAFIAHSGLQASEQQAQIPATEPERTHYLVTYYLGFLPIIVVPAIMVLPPVWCYIAVLFYFRRSPLAGAALTYHFSDEGIQLESASHRQASSWDLVSSAHEGRRGFLLRIGKRGTQFHWVPKSGFDSPDDVDSFRDLLARHVPKFRAAR